MDRQFFLFAEHIQKSHLDGRLGEMIFPDKGIHFTEYALKILRILSNQKTAKIIPDESVRPTLTFPAPQGNHSGFTPPHSSFIGMNGNNYVTRDGMFAGGRRDEKLRTNGEGYRIGFYLCNFHPLKAGKILASQASILGGDSERL